MKRRIQPQFGRAKTRKKLDQTAELTGRRGNATGKSTHHSELKSKPCASRIRGTI